MIVINNSRNKLMFPIIKTIKFVFDRFIEILCMLFSLSLILVSTLLVVLYKFKILVLSISNSSLNISFNVIYFKIENNRAYDRALRHITHNYMTFESFHFKYILKIYNLQKKHELLVIAKMII